MTLQGHPRSLILVPIRKRVCDFLLVLSSNIGPILHVSEILELLYAESHFFPHSTPVPAKISGCFPCSRSMMFRSAKSDYPRLTNREIIFEEFHPM